MGVAVSNYRLANAVAQTGNLGVVSGTGLDAVLARRLQSGDPMGELADAFAAFPVREMAERVWSKYFNTPHEPGTPFLSRPLARIDPPQAWLDLTIVANFVEVWLAKRGHSNPIGINLLEKIQLPHLASLFGAMLAGVDYVLMGAGIPRQIPAILDSLAKLEKTSYRLDVEGSQTGEIFTTELDPKSLGNWGATELKRPKFLAIVSSNILAIQLVKKCTPPVDGLIVEFPVAGGHNAPPRGALNLDENQEPIYGAKDEVNLEAIAELGVPFWLAGAYGRPGMLKQAIANGATGIQVGTAFAFCDESGIDPFFRKTIINQVLDQTAVVHTNALASPTGFPFKVVNLPGSVAEIEVVNNRQRVCDLGYLRTAYRKDDGSVGFRCPAEPIDDYVRKGGDAADCDGRICICNGLFATIGLPQTRKTGEVEPPLITAGNDLVTIGQYIKPGENSYTAAQVIQALS
jgi:nitronate monooxygenase